MGQRNGTVIGLGNCNHKMGQWDNGTMRQCATEMHSENVKWNSDRNGTMCDNNETICTPQSAGPVR